MITVSSRWTKMLSIKVKIKTAILIPVIVQKKLYDNENYGQGRWDELSKRKNVY